MENRRGIYQPTPVTVLGCCGESKRTKPIMVPAGLAFGMKTGLVRLHPFKPGWTIRRCFDCGQTWAVDGKIMTQ